MRTKSWRRSVRGTPRAGSLGGTSPPQAWSSWSASPRLSSSQSADRPARRLSRARSRRILPQKPRQRFLREDPAAKSKPPLVYTRWGGAGLRGGHGAAREATLRLRGARRLRVSHAKRSLCLPSMPARREMLPGVIPGWGAAEDMDSRRVAMQPALLKALSYALHS